MHDFLSTGLGWWITVVDIPVMSGLFWLVLRIRHDADRAVDTLHETLEVRCSQLREGLSGFKLEVAKTYASITDMKDLELRIVAHLLRIEAKLDRTALATAELKARQQE